MAKSKPQRKRSPKRRLALPNLEQAKTAVLNSLTSTSGQRTYDHAIRECVAWSCSKPHLAFNGSVVLRYRIHLERHGYAPTTINLRLAAVRRVAYKRPMPQSRAGRRHSLPQARRGTGINLCTNRPCDWL